MFRNCTEGINSQKNQGASSNHNPPIIIPKLLLDAANSDPDLQLKENIGLRMHRDKLFSMAHSSGKPRTVIPLHLVLAEEINELSLEKDIVKDDIELYSLFAKPYTTNPSSVSFDKVKTFLISHISYFSNDNEAKKNIYSTLLNLAREIISNRNEWININKIIHSKSTKVFIQHEYGIDQNQAAFALDSQGLLSYKCQNIFENIKNLQKENDAILQKKAITI
jgi:hypothetical protein